MVACKPFSAFGPCVIYNIVRAANTGFGAEHFHHAGENGSHARNTISFLKANTAIIFQVISPANDLKPLGSIGRVFKSNKGILAMGSEQEQPAVIRLLPMHIGRK
jgi:hypothetical protein